jgi:hypothetical protein
MLACHIHSTDTLDLSFNKLKGTIPNELALLSNLRKFCVLCLFVAMVVVMCFSLYSHVCLSYSFYSFLVSLQ